MKYRADIDGLRALAVLPVIFFHAGFESFSGGYVGVDVFFVISGYLITNIIITEINEGKFDIIEFYERRARRILPALFFVMATSLPFAWFVFTPIYLQSFGQSLVAVSTFSSNIFFAWESGYFDTSAELKPFLHTWSLAVEEQYYILFPIFLSLLWRFGFRFIVVVSLIFFVVSLAGAQWGSLNRINANFYLLPSRGWELLLGSFSAFYLHKKMDITPHAKNQALSLIGFCLVVCSIVFFDDSTPFPSLYTLFPTVGTSLIITSAFPGTLTYKILSFSPFVRIGLISYSSYLWHQPLLTFAKFETLGSPSDVSLMTVCIFSLAMGWLSWRFIERPFRDKSRVSRRFIFRFSILGMATFFIIGCSISFTNGLESLKIQYDFSETERTHYSIISKSMGYDMYEYMYSDECRVWVKEIEQVNSETVAMCFSRYGSPLVVLGDSHAMNVYNVFAKSDQFQFIIGVSHGGCRPHAESTRCIGHYEHFFEYMQNNLHLDPTIIFHQSGSYFVNDEEGNWEPSFDKTLFYDQQNIATVVDYLERLATLGVSVFWLGPFAEYRLNPLKSIEQILDIPSTNFEIFDKIEKEITKQVSRDISFRYVPFNLFFNVPKNPIDQGCFLWMNEDHFSRCGEGVIAAKGDFTFLLGK